VLDGKAIHGNGHNSVSYFAFSPDNRHFVYSAGKDNKQSVILDGKAGPFYSLTGKPVWSPDGKHLAYVALYNQDVQCVVLDGKEGKQYNGINIPIFSSDSKHIAYSVREGTKRFVVVDGKEGRKYEMNATISLLNFAPDDNRLAYAVAKDGKWVVVIDGKESFAYDGIGGGGSSITLRSGGIGESGSIITLSLGGVGGSRPGIALSPDGKSFAYVAYEKGKWFIVLNGEELQKYDGIALGTPIFSPDGKLFYGARLENKWFTVMDGEESADEYDEIGQDVSFSADGKHIVYSARRGNKWFVVLDGKAGKEYDRLFKPVFTDSKIEYLSERDSEGRILRIRQPYPDGDIDAEAYKAMVEEIKVAVLPEP
jgi:WD40 repeat protein